MLSKPKHGWTSFSLGQKIYSLSYLTNIPIDWLDQATHGLETLLPFAVHGFCEPGRVVCAVSYWNCHIIFENDEQEELSAGDTHWETAHISMLDFCKKLHACIAENIDDWSEWNSSYKITKTDIQTRLDRLQTLIQSKENRFDDRHCFI